MLTAVLRLLKELPDGFTTSRGWAFTAIGTVASILEENFER
jgi:hypothetical protein